MDDLLIPILSPSPHADLNRISNTSLGNTSLLLDPLYSEPAIQPETPLLEGTPSFSYNSNVPLHFASYREQSHPILDHPLNTMRPDEYLPERSTFGGVGLKLCPPDCCCTRCFTPDVR